MSMRDSVPHSIRVAFYKKSDGVLHRLIRWWTKSEYSHAELILPDDVWISISPFLNSRVSIRKNENFCIENWDFVELAVTKEQLEIIWAFYELTKDQKYDWIGMFLSQFLPFHIKARRKWYCSEWITYALRISGVLKWEQVQIYDQADLSPGYLFHIVTIKNPDQQVADGRQQNENEVEISSPSALRLNEDQQGVSL